MTSTEGSSPKEDAVDLTELEKHPHRVMRGNAIANAVFQVAHRRGPLWWGKKRGVVGFRVVLSVRKA